jgi:hypothetical protein
MSKDAEEFNVYQVLWARKDGKPVFFVNSGPAEEDEYEPGDGGQWWLLAGTDTWYSISGIREEFSDPKPARIVRALDEDDEEANDW